MSYSPYGTAPQPVLDPTAVTGKRVLAWIIDAIIYMVLINGIGAIAGNRMKIESHNLAGSNGTQFCSNWNSANHGFCTFSGDTATTVSGWSHSLILFGILFVVFCVVQGALGGSLGKLSMGLRIVKPDGSQAGIGASFIRTIMWIVDAITCFVPLVGLITMLSTKGHRRVGDMAASTFVVDQRQVGNPVILPGDPRYGYMGPSGFGTQPPGGYGTPTGGFANQPGGFGIPAGSPSYGQPSQSANYEADKPVWDDARNTYIQFDTQRQAWLEFNQASQEWKPISTGQPDQATASGPASGPTGQARPPETPSPWSTPPDPASPVLPTSTPTTSTPTTATPATPTPASQAATNQSSDYEADKPVWDEARNAYIQFDTHQNSWLEYDDKAKQWKPISSA